MLSQRPSESDLGSRIGGGNSNGKIQEKNEGGRRDTNFYKFYDTILETPAPSVVSGSQQKQGSVKGSVKGSVNGKGKGKGKNDFQDTDWCWETY